MTNPDLEQLALTLVDLRGTTESIRRALAKAEANLERYQQAQARGALTDLAACLVDLRLGVSVLDETSADAGPVLKRLLDGASLGTSR